MRQLGLFEDIESRVPTLDVPHDAAVPGWASALDEPLAGQLALFGDRWLRLGRVRMAIAEARFDDARLDSPNVRNRFPADSFLVREAERTAGLAKRLPDAMAATPHTRAARILAVAKTLDDADGDPWKAARRTLLRRVAVELCAAEGDSGCLEGQPPGWYLLEAGAVDEAVSSLRATLAFHSDLTARTLFLLGDATTLQGEQAVARRHYLSALLLDPFDAALPTAQDAEIRTLPAVARYEIELEDEPTAWCAPVGIVTGVLPSPAGHSSVLLDPPGGPTWTPAQRAASARARAFVGALVNMASLSPGDTGAIIEVRRTMKRLSPALFAAFMDRVVSLRARR